MPKVRTNNCGKRTAMGFPRRYRKKVAKREEEEKEIMPNLGNDVISNILTRIPADTLHKTFWCQSKEWFDILSLPSFIEANSLCSKAGIIYITSGIAKKQRVIKFVEFHGLEMKTRELSMFKTGLDLKMLSSCNGLVLVNKRPGCSTSLVILNPATKEIIRIPRCKHECLWHELVYVPSTKEYKVVDMFYDRVIDAWVFHIRSISGGWNDSYCSSEELEHITVQSSYNSMLSHVYWNERISIGGIVYASLGRRIISLDVCKEKVRILEAPARGPSPPRYIELSGFFSCVDCVGNVGDNFPLDVWILKDINVGEWEKKFSIASFPEYYGSRYGGFYWHRVVGSLNNGEIIVFTAAVRAVFAYDVKTRQWNRNILEEDGEYFDCCQRVHVNTLLSLR